jgi:predicted AAA+ superfamily ATPase
LIKKRAYDGISCNYYFWRTTQQQEIDFIEERDGNLTAYEFKWNPSKRAKLNTTFNKAYPNTEFAVINRDNYLDFLL